jgi:hypothetical protein
VYFFPFQVNSLSPLALASANALLNDPEDPVVLAVVGVAVVGVAVVVTALLAIIAGITDTTLDGGVVAVAIDGLAVALAGIEG